MAANVGKYMRWQAVASLRAVAAKEREGTAENEDGGDDYGEGGTARGEDLNVCCHGRAAGPEVIIRFVPFILLS